MPKPSPSNTPNPQHIAFWSLIRRQAQVLRQQAASEEAQEVRQQSG